MTLKEFLFCAHTWNFSITIYGYATDNSFYGVIYSGDIREMPANLLKETVGSFEPCGDDGNFTINLI